MGWFDSLPINTNKTPSTGALPKISGNNLPINSTKASALFPASCKLTGAKASGGKAVSVSLQYKDKDGSDTTGDWLFSIPGLPTGHIVSGAEVRGNSISVTIYDTTSQDTYEKSWQILADEPAPVATPSATPGGKSDNNIY
jgi:hypothetical protein